MDRQSVLDKLHEVKSDERFRAFSEALAPSSHPVLGVRLPALRTIGKEIAGGDWRVFLDQAGSDSFEEVLLRGFVIGYAKMSTEERISRIGTFVEDIDGWAVCDSACATFTDARKHPDAYWTFILPYFDSANPWAVRFAIIMAMDYFIDDRHIDQVLALLANVRSDFYYVQMGAGWALSVCFVKFRDKTMALLESGQVMPQIRHKAIQKCIESLRVDAEDKRRLKLLRATIAS